MFKKYWKRMLEETTDLDTDGNVTACQLFWYTIGGTFKGLGAIFMMILIFAVMAMVLVSALLPIIDFVRYYLMGLPLLVDGEMMIYGYFVWGVAGFWWADEKIKEYRVYSREKAREEISKPYVEPTPVVSMWRSFKDKTCYTVDISEW